MSIKTIPDYFVVLIGIAWVIGLITILLFN